MIEQLQISTSVGTFDAIGAGPEDGAGVLLLHGFPEASVQWEEQIGALATAGYRAIAPDQRGYSPDVRPENVVDYRMDELVGDVLLITEQLGWHRFHLVGHDWGAAVAWAFAAEHPDRLRSLTAVSVPHPAPFGQALREDEDQAQRSAYMQLFRQPRTAERRLLADDAKALRQIYEYHVPPSRVEDYVTRLSEPGALTAALNWYRAMGRGARTTEKITVPTLYVWGTEDVAIGSTAALATEQWVTGPYRFEMLEDISHWVCEQASIELSDLLVEHLWAHRS
ncbi:MAG TPA: alpha/beta hydrolase [Pseudonocardiaceae bacterium]|nr:alpha/beta hydrolase [Pseudonocardiaceae bacterium]